MAHYLKPPLSKGGEVVVTLRFYCWVGCCNREAKWLLQLLSNVGEGLCALPPQRKCIKLETHHKCGVPPQSLPCQREGDQPKAGGGIPQRQSAASETPPNCGTSPHPIGAKRQHLPCRKGGFEVVRHRQVLLLMLCFVVATGGHEAPPSHCLDGISR